MRRIVFVIGCLLALMVNMSAKSEKSSASSLQNEMNVRKYNMFYLEAMCQKAVGHTAAEFDLINHALKYCPNAPEAIFELAQLEDKNPLFKEDEVDSLYKVALSLDSTNNQIRWELARHQVTIGKLGEAASNFEKLTKDIEKRDKAYSYLATIYEHEDNDSMLLNVLNRWEAECGGDENVSMEKFRAYEHMQRYDEALALLDTLCKNSPQSDYYPILVAETYLEKGDTAKALAKNAEVQKKSPDNSYSQLFMVRYYQMSGQNQKLEKEVEQIILNPKIEMETRSSFFQTYIKSRAEKQAYKIDSLFQLVLQEPMSSNDLLEVYTSYLAQKNAPDSAYAPIWTKMLEVDPSDRVSRLREAYSLFQQEKYKDAIRSCEEGIKYNKDQMLLYILGGKACMIQKNYAQASDFFQKGVPYVATEKDSSSISDFFSTFGDVAHELGNKEESYALYDSSLVYNPSNVETLNNYSYFLSLDGKHLEKAKMMSALTVKYEPDEATFLDTYAWVLFKLKDYENARSYIEKALQNLKGSSSDGSLYEHAGDIYFHLGMKQDALDCWKKAKGMGVDSKTLNSKIKQQKYIEE